MSLAVRRTERPLMRRIFSAYESAAVRANIWNTAMPPIYRMISMTSILFILYFGGRNVLQEGWTPWNIAVFTTFLSCYTKLATKSSSAAKLFNAVHKAQVSWKRIKPLLQNSKTEPELPAAAPAELNVDHLHFAIQTEKRSSMTCRFKRLLARSSV